MKNLKYALPFLSFLILIGTIDASEAMKPRFSKDTEKKPVGSKRTEKPLEVGEKKQPAALKKQKSAEAKAPETEIIFKKPMLPRSKPPTPEPSDPFEKLVFQTRKLDCLRTAVKEIYGLNLDDLILEVRNGSKEAPGIIGTACYLVERRGLDIYPISVDPFEDYDASTLAFQWLSHAHLLGDQSILEELAFCNLYEIGIVIGYCDAMILFKKAQSIIPVPLSTQEAEFKRRLMRAESGFDRYVEIDLVKDRVYAAFLKEYNKQKQKTAQCILANALIRLNEKPHKVKEGLNFLKSLSEEKKYPLAQWLYGRALMDGIGTKKQLDLGLKWIIESAQKNCPQAMLFLNSAFPLKADALIGQDNDNPFKGTLISETNKLLKSLDLASNSLDKLHVFEGHKDFSTFSRELQDLLNSVKKAEPGLWVTCLGMSPELETRSGEFSKSELIEYADNCFNIGPDAIRISQSFKTYIAQVEEKFKAAQHALIKMNAGIKAKIAEMKSQLEKADPKEVREITYKLKSLERKKGRVKDCFTELPNLKTGLLELKDKTAAKTNQNFLGHHAFFYKIQEEEVGK